MTGVVYRFLKLDQREADFDTRGFSPCDPTARANLEFIGKQFIAGFNCGLRCSEVLELRVSISHQVSVYQGFFAEGTAMGVAVADAARPWRPLLPSYLKVCESDFDYLTHVGAGWALARVPWRRRAILATLDIVHVWLAYDGLGFHDAYFSPQRLLSGWKRERSGYETRAYDQGVGRALWFVCGANVTRISDVIAALDRERSADLWSGVGLAMTYAGSGDAAAPSLVKLKAGSCVPMLLQGAAFAAEACSRAGPVPPQVVETVRLLTGLSCDLVVDLVRDARESIESIHTEEFPPYEIWRRRVQHALQGWT